MTAIKLSKAKKTIIKEVNERWLLTIFGGQPDIKKASECIFAGYANGIGAYKYYDPVKQPKIHVVSSPLAFGIAHALKRGRMTKRFVRDLCMRANIDYSQFHTIRRDRGIPWREVVPSWYTDVRTEFSRTWLRAVDDAHRSLEETRATDVEKPTGIRHRRWGGAQNPIIDFRINNLNSFALIARSTLSDVNPSYADVGTSTKNADVRSFLDKVLLHKSTTLKTINTLADAYRGKLEELKDGINDQPQTGLFMRAEMTAADAEIAMRLLGVTDLKFTWEYEFFHHATAFAAFEDSCIILAARPTMRHDEDGELHSENSAAVEWPDGTKLWFNHGHIVDEFGRQIVTEPERLSIKQILAIDNEETRRVAIDRYGWDRFITEADCLVLDRRENDVDNTIEMLVGMPVIPSRGWSRPSNKMVLFCRSTGRRYFLSVPNDITTCEGAQNWMSNSGTLEHNAVPYANNRIRLVGAS